MVVSCTGAANAIDAARNYTGVAQLYPSWHTRLPSYPATPPDALKHRLNSIVLRRGGATIES